MPFVKDTLQILREATRGTQYEGKLYLVGGYVRDKLLGAHANPDDIDLVLEDDALEAARFLWKKRVTDHAPVEYGQFGTTQIEIRDVKVELVTAREETYRQGSRKPIVKRGTLATDALRRDFTVNTFLENLHTGEISDPTGYGYADLEAKILRTPLDANITFQDDPLRMLRACRFAAKLGFVIVPETYAAIKENAFRLSPEHGISFERIHDELNKTLLAPGASRGLELMRESGLLALFAPELAAMYGVTQNRFHKYDVWTHTLAALDNLSRDADLCVRLAVLLHDSGKPVTRTEESSGDVHFYGHEEVGAGIAKTLLTRLRYSTDEIERVTRLVGLHMRYGSYDPEVWTDAAVRRLIRDVGPHRTDLFTIARADISACNSHDPETGALLPTADLNGLQERMERIESEAHITQLTSPLTGQEIMALLEIKPGRIVGRIKDALTDAVVEGTLAPDDRDGAVHMVHATYAKICEEDTKNLI
jgi:tRNA nucleotidyltransferase/poly(A) polymerase